MVPRRPRRRAICRSFACGLLVFLVASPLAAQSIHEQIDQLLLASASSNPPAPLASDAEFLRRVFLDLNGTIPTSGEARAFLANADPGKRAKLIDDLLARPAYARRMQEAFSVMLMERRGRDGPAVAKWEQFLHDAFAQNRPWDQIARQILNPDPQDESTRGSALFIAKRLEAEGQVPIDYPGLARDVGRMFLGVDLKCAQCHNHRSIKSYKQADFQGLFAFVSNTYIRTDLGLPTVGEKPLLKKLEFVSVFAPDDKRQTGPRLPGMAEIEVPAYAEKEAWAQPPDKAKKFPGLPKFSPLKNLAEQLPRADNAAFSRNIANRIWFLMMGQGIVQPLDLHHAANPPSHPALLDYLAEQFAAQKFDVKAFVREIALSDAYQCASVLPPGQADPGPRSYRVANAKRLSAEQLMWSTLTATGELDAVLAAKAEPAAKGAKGTPATAPSTAPATQRSPAPTLAEVKKTFWSAFANPAGEPETEFAPTVASALFLSNDKTILDRLTPRPGNLVDRLMKLPSSEAVSEELYLSVLTRLPTNEERVDVSAYLAKRGDAGRAEALAELAWSLLASTEFCVNH